MPASSTAGAPPTFTIPDLPTTDHEFVLACRREAEAATGTAGASQKTFQLAWALVHSTWASDVRAGRELAKGLAEAAATTDPAAARDASYLEAVGAAKGGDLIAARRLLAGLLASTPGWRQAAGLKAAVDEAIVREGLVGLGVGAGVLGAVALAVAAFARRT